MNQPLTITESGSIWPPGTETRSALYGTALVELASENEKIVCLGGDLSKPTETDLFRQRFPERFFNFGAAEANLVSAAAGMAREGDIPFVNTFGVFATRRCFDQVAMQVAYPPTNVKLIGFMPGLSSPGGPTHQAIDDVALMRALPNMTVLEPACANQVATMLRAVAAFDGPVYMRIKRGDMPVLLPEDAPFKLGKAQTVQRGGDGVIFASGVMVAIALDAAKQLKAGGHDVGVCNIHTLKPLDAQAVVAAASEAGTVVTAENHSIIGGLGSAVAEAIAEAGLGVGFARVGIEDRFAEGASAPYLFETYGLTAKAIIAGYHRAAAAC